MFICNSAAFSWLFAFCLSGASGLLRAWTLLLPRLFAVPSGEEVGLAAVVPDLFCGFVTGF